MKMIYQLISIFIVLIVFTYFHREHKLAAKHFLPLFFVVFCSVFLTEIAVCYFLREMRVDYGYALLSSTTSALVATVAVVIANHLRALSGR